MHVVRRVDEWEVDGPRVVVDSSADVEREKNESMFPTDQHQTANTVHNDALSMYTP